MEKAEEWINYAKELVTKELDLRCYALLIFINWFMGD